MSATSRCASASLVARHFEGKIDPADERVLREHLPGCESCTRLYGRQLVLARLDPSAPRAVERLGRGLGIARRPRTWLPYLGLVSAALTIALVVLTPLHRSARVDDRAYAPRGSAADVAQLRVYRLHEGAPAELISGVVHAADELAFAYANPAGRKHLLVFAIDEADKIYWYVPAWTDPASEPRSLAIAAGSNFNEVSDAVTHELTGKHLTVHALFTDESYSVREIESMLALAPQTLARLGRPHLQVELEVAP